MIELKYSTKRGKDIVARASYYDGYTLDDVYDSYSYEKEKAYEWCFNEYVKTEDSDSFSICSHNTFQFTCSWLGKKDGEDILRYETANNSYLVWLER